jgi:hypothetical protein
MKHEQVILGNAPSKANQYKIITLGGHGSEDEDEYLSKVARDAEIMMQQQECQQLFEVLSEEYQLDI